MEIEFPGSPLYKCYKLQLPCTLDMEGATNQCPGNVTTKKSLCQQITMKKQTLYQVKVCKKLSPCQLEVSKQHRSQRVSWFERGGGLIVTCYTVDQEVVGSNPTDSRN